MKCKCDYCGKEFERYKSGIKRAKNNFCSIKCKNLYQQKENKIIIENNYAKLIIFKKGEILEVLIDIDDIDKINNLKWTAKYDKTINNYYIYAWERNKLNNNRKRFSLHRYLTNCPQDMQVDHINRNTLDNRRCNLKICTHLENLQNKGFYKNNKTGYKYIHFIKSLKTYSCEIKENKKTIFRKRNKDINIVINARDEFLNNRLEVANG